MLEEGTCPGREGEAVVVALVLVEAGVQFGGMLFCARVVAIADGRVAFFQAKLGVESLGAPELDDSLAMEEMLICDEVTQNML